MTVIDPRELQRNYAEDILGGRAKVDSRWQRNCCGYNLLAIPSSQTREHLGLLQRNILDVEPTLLECPVDTLHISLMPLLAVRSEYQGDKEEIWRSHGSDWIAGVTETLAHSRISGLRYRSLVATDSAVIALAEPRHRVQRMRMSLYDRLRLPPGGPPMLDLVHTTIFRYGSQLRFPEKLLDLIGNLDVDIGIEIDLYVVSHEQIYPHLRAETVAAIRPRRLPVLVRGR